MKKLLKIVVSLLLTLGVGAPGIVLAEDFSDYFVVEEAYTDDPLYFYAEISDDFSTISSKSVGDTVNLKVYSQSVLEEINYDYDNLDQVSYITYTGTITEIEYSVATCSDNERYGVSYTITYDGYTGSSYCYVEKEGTATGEHSACYGDFKEALIAEGYDETDWDAINAYVTDNKDDEGNYIVYIYCAWCSEYLTSVSTTKYETSTLTSGDYTYILDVYYFTYEGKEYTEEYEMFAYLTSKAKTVSLSSLNLGTITNVSVSEDTSFGVYLVDGNLLVALSESATSGTYSEDVTLTLEDGSTKVITVTVVYDADSGDMNVTLGDSSSTNGSSEESSDSEGSSDSEESSDSVETADTSMIMAYSLIGLAALAGVVYTKKKREIL